MLQNETRRTTMTITRTATDVVAAILGEDTYARIEHLRLANPQQIDDLQAYYAAIFDPEPASLEALDLETRALVAIRVASHTRSRQVIDWYSDLAQSAGASEASIVLAAEPGALPGDAPRLTAALHRADRIAIDPASAEREDIEALEAAGFTPAGILSLSQVIAFVAYQVRFIALLRALGGTTA
jgi:uncharacterized protein YciW